MTRTEPSVPADPGCHSGHRSRPPDECGAAALLCGGRRRRADRRRGEGLEPRAAGALRLHGARGAVLAADAYREHLDELPDIGRATVAALAGVPARRRRRAGDGRAPRCDPRRADGYPAARPRSVERHPGLSWSRPGLGEPPDRGPLQRHRRGQRRGVVRRHPRERPERRRPRRRARRGPPVLRLALDAARLRLPPAPGPRGRRRRLRRRALRDGRPGRPASDPPSRRARRGRRRLLGRPTVQAAGPDRGQRRARPRRGAGRRAGRARGDRGRGSTSASLDGRPPGEAASAVCSRTTRRSRWRGSSCGSSGRSARARTRTTSSGSTTASASGWSRRGRSRNCRTSRPSPSGICRSIWSNANLKDAVAGVPSTLGWSIIQRVLRAIIYTHLQTTGLPGPGGHGDDPPPRRAGPTST